MLTFSFESDHPLIGCGIDSEKTGRFNKYIDRKEPLPHVFSRKEVEHIHTLEHRAFGLCLSFCCKEALYKAAGGQINFPECEFFYHPGREHSLDYSLPDKISKNITDCRINYYHQAEDEIMVLLYLFGETR